MSVYDFNHNEAGQADSHTQIVTANHHQSFRTNGFPTSARIGPLTSSSNPANKYQTDRTDYPTRNQYSSNQPSNNHHTTTGTHISTEQNISVQLTRPTSKTAMLVRKRRAILEQLSCYICKGYLIDATTIDECMDSFCKSCIVIYFRTHNNCPKCGVLVHETNPYSAIHLDKVLQDIVYKMVPGLYDNEMKRRRDFYRNRYNLSTPSETDDEESMYLPNGSLSKLQGEQYGRVPRPKPFYKLTDMVDLSLEPQARSEGSNIYYDNKRQSIVTSFTGTVQEVQQLPMFSTVEGHQFKVYLRCPAKLTTLQLKKFIAAKFNVCKDDTIHLLYLNETLKDEYSLIDIAYIYDWRGNDSMGLFYIIERNITRKSLYEYQLENETQKVKSSRQSVGTSTQTVKRVCIDPTPKFYQETSAKMDLPISNSDQRVMRSRSDQSKKQTTNPVSQPPILRSTPNSTSPRTRASTLEVSIDKPSISRTIDHQQQKCSPSVTGRYDPIAQRTNNSSSNGNSQHTEKNISKSNRTTCFNEDSKSSTNTYQKSSAKLNNGDSNEAVVVPYKRLEFPSVCQSVASVTTQSSIMTLTNFTRARSSHADTSGSNATSTNNSQSGYRVPIDNGPSVPSKPSVSCPAQRIPTSSPQLAFSFVTERGITIVRRLHNPDGTPMTSSSIFGSRALANPSSLTSNPVIPALPSTSSPSVEVASSVSSGFNGTSNPKIVHPIHQSPTKSIVDRQVDNSNKASNNARSNALHSTSGSASPSSRHLTKVKPVYKTFVDPTKIKSPNLKRLNYTARH